MVWGAQHKHALKTVLALGHECGVKGRGRCAAEGLNCTLTGTPSAVRAFCNGLRRWQPPLFEPTDFKISDGIAAEHAFKALTIQKRADLVAYGLPSEMTPALSTSRARHVEADECAAQPSAAQPSAAHGVRRPWHGVLDIAPRRLGRMALPSLPP